MFDTNYACEYWDNDTQHHTNSQKTRICRQREREREKVYVCEGVPSMQYATRIVMWIPLNNEWIKSLTQTHTHIQMHANGVKKMALLVTPMLKNVNVPSTRIFFAHTLSFSMQL